MLGTGFLGMRYFAALSMIGEWHPRPVMLSRNAVEAKCLILAEYSISTHALTVCNVT